MTSSPVQATARPAFAILFAVGFCHFLNDMVQSVIPAIYPIIKDNYHLSFAQIGVITLVFQITSSIFQPFVGMYADRRPQPFSLAVGMCFTLVGLLLVSVAGNFAFLLISVALVGCGSSVFHPESSRVALTASGGRKGLAQSIFQVGGNGGSALGPLLAALIVLPVGQHAVAIFAIAALLAAVVLARVGVWYKKALERCRQTIAVEINTMPRLTAGRIRKAMAILIVLIFSKYFFNACMTSYFTFYLIDKFHISVQASQLCLFAFLAAFAAGTLIGGVVGDKYGRKYVILFSILGAAPFTLAMPYLNLPGTVIMAVISGFIIASAFSAILVYATDMMPDKVGLVAGVFFGLMFGLGGLGSAFFGWMADITGIDFVFHISTLLPMLGIVAVFLPDIHPQRK